MELVPDIDRLTQIFSNAVAPSFFLGAVAAFVSLMMSRLAACHADIKATKVHSDQDDAAVGSSSVPDQLTRRARLLNDGIILSLGGGVCATLLLAPFRKPILWLEASLRRGGFVICSHVALRRRAVSVRPRSLACSPRIEGIAIKD